MTRRIAFGDEQAECGQHAHDLLLARLATPPDAVLGRAFQPVLVDLGRWRRPHVPEDVEVEVLQGSGHHQVTPAGKQAAGLGAPQRLAPGEGHEVGAFRNETPEIVLRWQLRGGVDQHGNASVFDDQRQIPRI